MEATGAAGQPRGISAPPSPVSPMRSRSGGGVGTRIVSQREIERKWRELAPQIVEVVKASRRVEMLAAAESASIEITPSLANFIEDYASDPSRTLDKLAERCAWQAIRLYCRNPDTVWSSDLERLIIVARAYRTLSVAADHIANNAEQVPDRAGMASADAIGTLEMGGYSANESGKYWVPPHADPAKIGRQWRRRTRAAYEKRAAPADPYEALHDDFVRMLFGLLPNRKPGRPRTDARANCR